MSNTPYYMNVYVNKQTGETEYGNCFKLRETTETLRGKNKYHFCYTLIIRVK